MNDSKVPWTINDVVAAMVLFLIAITGGSFVVGRLLAEVSPRAGSISAVIIGYLALFLLIRYYAITKRDADWTALGFRSFDLLRGLGLAVVWFFLIRIITFIYAFFAEQIGFEPPEDMLRRIPEIFGRDIAGFLLAVTVIVVIAPVIEELFFRGFIYPAFRQRWGIAIAIVASGLLFALFHFNLFLFIPFAVIGFVLAYLYEQTNSLGPPIMLHALNNFVSIILIYYGRILPGG